MDGSEIIALVAVVTSSIVAILSPWLMHRLTGRQENNRWFREGKLRVYEELLAHAHLRSNLVRRAAMRGEKLSPAFGEEAAELATKVEIYASSAVRAAWYNLHVTQLQVLRRLPISQQDGLGAVADVGSMLDLLVSDVRADLDPPRRGRRQEK